MGDPHNFDQSTYGATRASKEKALRSTRALLDVAAPGDVKKWIDNFFSNQAYGAFCMNVLADIFVRLVLLICTYLALFFCWKAKTREARLTELQLQRYLENSLESQKRYLRSDSFSKRVTQALQSSPAPLLVPGGQVQANLPDSASGSSGQQVLLNSFDRGNGTDQNGLHDSEKLRKRLNGYAFDCHIPDRSRSNPGLASTSSSSEISFTSRSRTAPTEAQNVETVDEVVIDIITVQGAFPTSASMETGNNFKHIMKNKLGVPCDHDISSSRILQARVRATDENLSALHDLAVEGMKVDQGFTLQIGGSFMYYCNGNPEEPVLLSLTEVPTVLQADYAAGVLTIRGIYLEEAEIRAATFDGYMIINCIKQDQADNNIGQKHPWDLGGMFSKFWKLEEAKKKSGFKHSKDLPEERRIEVWRCTDLLPPVKLDQIQICASKTVRIESHDLTVRSEVCSIQNTTVKIVIRNWVPTTILIVFLACQAWILLALLLNLMTVPLHRTWLSYPVLALAIYIIHLLPSSLEDNIKAFVERLKLAILSFHLLPDLFSSPAFFMRNGYCFQRGAKHLVDSKLIVGAPHHVGIPDGCSDNRGRRDKKGGLPHSSKVDGKIPPSSRDWKWPCWIEEIDKETKNTVTRRFDPDLEQKSHDSSVPFTVTYQTKARRRARIRDCAVSHEYIPKDIKLKLYSKHLQDVIGRLLPTKFKLFEMYGEIQAKDVFVLYISKVLEKEANLDTGSNDESKEECLDLFHLIRFLQKEYEDTIKQYERMMEADVISWDMLWTLIVPKADVIYYCDISKEELCGKVISTDYKIVDGDEDEFTVRLEVYDYNCINFEVVRSKTAVLPFIEELKISDVDVYPLQHSANSHKAEEFFLTRGRKFYDLVLKYKHRYMEYEGLIYTPPTRPHRSPTGRLISSTSDPSSWTLSCKESIDGRVMLDQQGFAKMKPNLSMETAQPSRGWLQGIGLKMKTHVIDESDQVLKYAPAIAYGFSFSVRRWGCFTIEGISEIQFISTAFDILVMNEDIKNTLLTLTKHHIKQAQGSKDEAINVDPLPHKGKGCIILLHGPPGTGKTLTVESLAEKLECPLWQLSVPKNLRGEEDLEAELFKTFEVAASWRAILLLDEADVYLSSRKYSPLSSNVTATNAMTGVFLRVLEYYTGILFLTTNVIDSIEPAIYSRMSLFVKYEEFSIDDRRLLWFNFLNRIGFQHPSQDFWDEVLPHKFNGRVIRNIIQNAQILAINKGALLSEEHLLKACHVMAIPFTTDYSEDKPDPKQATTSISTYAPSVVTISTSSDFREEEKWRIEE